MTAVINKKALAYIIGVALGDGNLSNPNGRAVRLRVTCDVRYPRIIEAIVQGITELLPHNKVSIVKRADTYVDVSCFSNKWEAWLGWKAKGGSKAAQQVSVPAWIKSDATYTVECLRGLLQTDGSIYNDRRYTMVNFVTVIPPLADDVMYMIETLGYRPRLYRVFYSNANKYTKLTVRLSKGAESFITHTGLYKA